MLWNMQLNHCLKYISEVFCRSLMKRLRLMEGSDEPLWTKDSLSQEEINEESQRVSCLFLDLQFR